MKYTANVTETDLTEQATARARVLMEITAEVGGLELTERERAVVMLGVGLGIAASVATIRAVSIEQAAT